jgi:predicted enzyme related to lactoylglutathione lyase
VSNPGPGVPGWVDLSSSDLEASKTFYGGLLGWQVESNPDPQYGGYTMFLKDGKMVAGAGPLMMDGQPVAWTVYVIVDDAEATAASVTAAGGSVLVAPMVVPEQGTMAIFMDPTGAAFGVWQPAKMAGAELLGGVGSLAWSQLTTRDVEAAKRFYTAVFGWEPDDGTGYVHWHLDGEAIGGMMAMGDMFPPEVPAHWAVYFGVDDCDAAVAQAQQDGASVIVAPTDVGKRRHAGLVDPQGAQFFVVSGV